MNFQTLSSIVLICPKSRKETEMKRQWYYRGSLKSCNYSCSYCPFSNQKGQHGNGRQNGSLSSELQKDKTAFFHFTKEACGSEAIQGAVQIIPYGEALIHPYYWEGLAKLSRSPFLDAVGAQSNFSFPIEKMLSHYKECGGELGKLRLWGTFHPEMVSVERFIQQCHMLTSLNILYCIGVVGVPGHIEVIHKLRRALPQSAYLWVNKMDGLGRAYTISEKEAFLKIDPYFGLELSHYKADLSLCSDNRFIEADGTMHRCNLDRQIIGNFYSRKLPEKTPACNRKECSCYLSYCNRKDNALQPFLPYPAFRIPSGFSFHMPTPS